MEAKTKSNLFEEQIRKIKYKTGYKVNESPKYHPLIEDSDEFDDVPITEVGDQEEPPKPDGGEQPPEPSNDQPIGTEPPVPEFDKGEEPAAPEGEPMPEPTGGMGLEPPAPEVDDIQNEIIKHNIEAMKSIHAQLEALNSMTQSLNSKLENLSGEVEEVREPSNTEKLMSKKNVSYPYYFNLNDFWSGNWFNEQREKEASKGIRELPDGTYIADFDDLPLKSKGDVINSFNDIQ
jgi:hypothetical protein